MATRQDIVECARTQLGVPWISQGRIWNTALDCLGLIIGTAQHSNLIDSNWDYNGYSNIPDGSMIEIADQYLERIAEIELAAVIVLASKIHPQHFGIIGNYRHGGWSVIHSTNATNPPRVIETRLMFTKGFSYKAVYRFPGVEL